MAEILDGKKLADKIKERVKVGVASLNNSDIEFGSVGEKTSLMMPVPGGVCQVSVSMLLKKTVRSAQKSDLLYPPMMIV